MLGANSRIARSSSKRPPICAPAPAVYSISSMSFPSFRPVAASANAFEKCEDPLLDRLALVVAGMRHQVLGADGDGALELAAERRHRLARIFVRRRQVDQVVVVDHQRGEIVLLARAVQQRDGAGAGREALHCRGLAEKIWNVLAPSSAAFSADAREIWRWKYAGRCA